MSRSRGASPGSESSKELPLVLGCVASSLGQRRITSALRGAADVCWLATFGDLKSALEHERRRVLVVVIDAEDPTGASAEGFAAAMREYFRGIGVVAYVRLQSPSADLCGLGAAGVHDVLISGHTDEGYPARAIILAACRLGAADLVCGELERILPRGLQPFAFAIVRNPAKGTIGRIAQHLNVHRQTPNTWCRKERYLRPEELLVWCRMFLASALLELTGRTLDSIAGELDYASSTSLRNQLKKYTGMTATQIRDAGWARVIEVFKGRVAQVQVGFAGIEPAKTKEGEAPLRVLQRAKDR